jgi:hypothetical protein
MGIRREGGQVIVLFALLVPVILTFGSIVVSAGNWYVLKRHLQTQVDMAALAGGQGFLGCSQNPALANANVSTAALKFSGDTAAARAILPGSPLTAPYNLQLEDSGDQRAVLNSTNYWPDAGAQTDGLLYDYTDVSTAADAPKLGVAGGPCYNGYLDVKATDNKAPLLFRWIPLFPSPKSKARVELREFQGGEGIRPIGVPEVDPTSVAVVFVNEDAVGGVTSASAIVGKGPLTFWDPDDVDPLKRPPGELAGVSAWHTTSPTGVTANFNGNENFSAVVVASRDPGFSLNAGNGSLYDICHQNLTQTHCYGPGTTLQQGISFIHSYTDAGGGTLQAPIIRGVDLYGGCGVVGTPSESNPYFNVDDGTNCAAITIHANIDFGPLTDPSNPGAYPDCVRVTASPGGPMTYAGGGAWEATFVPAPGSGRNVVNISTEYKKPTASNCNQLNSGASFPRVAVPYVSDDDSGVVQYIRMQNLTTPGLVNSVNANGTTTDVGVVVGLTLPLRDAIGDPATDPPIPLRIWNTPSQSRTLDCQTSGANGWQDAMAYGCVAYQIYNQAWHISGCGPPPAGIPAPDPPDCIASQNGNYQQSVAHDLWASPCSATPNNWYTSINGGNPPLPNDPRWIPLFIVDETGFTVSGKKYYPVRRFGGFYVTAGSGMNCPYDDPPGNLDGKRTIYGHFQTYIPQTGGEVIPAAELCSFTEGGVCVPVLVE